MFERFTDRARRVVVLAQEEARMLRHNYIGTEHILLGLIQESEGIAARTLEALGVSLKAVRDQVEDIVGPGQQAPTGHIPFTPRGKKVLELSLREALQLGHDYIGTEHILLGIIREGDGVGANVLQQLGINLAQLREQVSELSGSEYRVRPPEAEAGLSELVTKLSDDRIWIAARKASAAISVLPRSQRLDALSRVQQSVLRGLIDEELRSAAAADEPASDDDEDTPESS